MTVVTHELKASYAFIERNFNLTRRYWGWELAFLVYSVAGALSISLIGVSQGSETLLLSLMIGAIFWNYLSVVFSQANQWFGGRTRTSRRLGLSGHPNQKSVQ
jgi:ABC-2 type transport system permease protein